MNAIINYEFKHLKIFEACNLIKNLLIEINCGNIFESEYQAKLILAHALNTDMTGLTGLLWNERISTDCEKEISKMLKRRQNHEPLQYIIGETEFYGRKFKVKPEVLIPRNDTECIVEETLKFINTSASNNATDSEHKLKIIDIGTGSGAIAITLACELTRSRNNFEIYAADISEKALIQAKENALINGVSGKINFIKSDVYDHFENTGQKFDIIISNPPYISKTEYLKLRPEIFFEPEIALTATENGTFFYKKILKDAFLYLNPYGTVIFEFGFGMYGEIEKIAINNNFKNIKKIYDIENRIRGVRLWV